MHYLIDGYNLLHHVGRLQSKVPANLELARADLLRLLADHFANRADQVTVVFDAQRAPPTAQDRDEYRGIQVRFTRYEEADDLIEALLRKAQVPQQVTVVSNDRRIREAARRRRCPVIECVEFWESLLQQPRPGREQRPAPERPDPSGDEVQDWVETFGELERDPGFRELFDPPQRGEDGEPAA